MREEAKKKTEELLEVVKEMNIEEVDAHIDANYDEESAGVAIMDMYICQEGVTFESIEIQRDNLKDSELNCSLLKMSINIALFNMRMVEKYMA